MKILIVKLRARTAKKVTNICKLKFHDRKCSIIVEILAWDVFTVAIQILDHIATVIQPIRVLQ